jgi:hypothetical protein
MMMRVLFALVLSLSAAQAFVVRSTSSRLSNSPLKMVKYDGTKWIATKPEEMPEAGYDPINTLILHGPKSWFTRVFQTDDYEQAVLKFMAGDKVGRTEAMGNMDAYMRNPADWQFNRMEEEKNGKKYDYWTLKKDTVVLVFVWSTIVLFFGGRAIVSLSTGEGFYDFLIPFLK